MPLARHACYLGAEIGPAGVLAQWAAVIEKIRARAPDIGEAPRKAGPVLLPNSNAASRTISHSLQSCAGMSSRRTCMQSSW